MCNKKMKSVYSYACIFICVAFMMNCHAGNTTQISRYVTVDNKARPEQINPLLAIAQYKFPANVRTVGEAVVTILHDTGFSIVDEKVQSHYVKDTLAKPLPITNRSLGPIAIKEALEVLMGKSVFYMVEDPLNRLVDFKLKPNVAKALGVKNAKNIA